MGDYSYNIDRVSCAAATKARGFTLLELIVTLAVAAILLGVAVPSYRSVVQRNTVAANVNDLIGDLNYARSEAVTRGQPVFVCSSVDQLSCTTGGDWSPGWVIYAAADPGRTNPTPSTSNRIRVHSETGNGFAFTANKSTSLSFDANGFASDALTFKAKSSNSAQTIQITVAATGRIEAKPAK